MRENLDPVQHKVMPMKESAELNWVNNNVMQEPEQYLKRTGINLEKAAPNNVDD